MAVDLDGRRDEAQIPGGGLPQGQQADALLLDLASSRSIWSSSRMTFRARSESLSRSAGGPVREGLFRQGAQIEKAVLDLLEFPLVFRAGMSFLFHVIPPSSINRTVR